MNVLFHNILPRRSAIEFSNVWNFLRLLTIGQFFYEAVVTIKVTSTISASFFIDLLGKRLREINLDRGTSNLRVRDVRNKSDSTYVLKNEDNLHEPIF